MKLSVLGEHSEFTVFGLTRTHLQIRLMKLGALGECAEGNKAPKEKTPSEI